ncbi:MAG: tetratricopeptide repeat protein [Calditrichaeota bacterium]|nr:tetratricopeptide repeat protein [Calditrichota bacterium]
MIENYSEEISWLKGQLNLNPKSMLFARLAERYLQMDEIDQAINVCKRGLIIHGDYATAHLVLARCYIKNQQFDEAVRELKNVLDYDPKALSAHKLYSELMQKIGQEETAKSSYQKMLDIDPLDDHVKSLLTELPANEGPPEPFEPLMEPKAGEKEEPFASVFDEEAEPEPAQPLTDALEEKAGTESDEPFTSVFDEEAETDFGKDLQGHAAETELLNEEEFSDSGIIDETLELESEDIEKPGLESKTTSEEARFSEILEDIFSPTLDEEEKQEEDARTALERVADKDLELDELPTDVDETSPPEKDQDEKASDELAVEKQADAEFTVGEETESGEEKAVKETPLAQEITVDEKENKRNGTDFLDAEINPFDLDEELVPDKESHETPQFEGIDLDEDEQKEAALGDFLSSLNDEKDFQSFGAPEEKKPSDFETPQAQEVEEVDEREEEEVDHMGIEEMTISTPAEKAEKPKEKFVTPTLGEIYAAQGQYAKAINVFELLVEKHPDNEWYRTKLDYLKKRLDEEDS